MGIQQGKHGEVAASGLRVAVVAARFNGHIVDPLLAGALATLAEHGAADANILVERVPGAFELPLAVRALAAADRCDAIIALGAVVRGETPHFDYVAGECARGLARVAEDYLVPVGFGMLAVDTEAQGLARAGGDAGNKGCEATLAALEMVHFLRRVEA